MSGLEARDAPGHEPTEPTAGGLDSLSERESQIALNAGEVVRKRTQAPAAALGRILIAATKLYN
jgi:hypothetical protein